MDRDGTLLKERGYLSDPNALVFYPGVFDALGRLRKAGFKLVVITNQSGVGRGHFTLATLKKINHRFRETFAKKGVRINGIYFCPHLPTAGCRCRKPKPMLAKKAAKDLNLDLKRSFVIGDQARDIRMAQNIGAKGVLVLTGAGRSQQERARPVAAKIAHNLPSATHWILSQAPIK